jgi:hypothetical protein
MSGRKGIERCFGGCAVVGVEDIEESEGVMGLGDDVRGMSPSAAMDEGTALLDGFICLFRTPKHSFVCFSASGKSMTTIFSRVTGCWGSQRTRVGRFAT